MHYNARDDGNQMTLIPIVLRMRALVNASIAGCAVAVFFAAARVGAQSPYANISESRPLGSEDALSIDRYALEAYLSPVSLERSNGVSGWSVNPGVAYGLVPRTQIEVAMPFGKRDVSGANSSGLLGIDLSALYAFNRESGSLPALAVRAGVLIPVGGIGPRNGHQSLKGIVTRTFGWGRLHFNHEYTFGAEPDDRSADSGGMAATDISRWITSLAVDKTLPLSGLLLGAEVFARRDIAGSDSPYWNAAVGARYELSPAAALDLGFVTTLNADSRTWAFRLGITRSFAVRTLAPGLGPWGR